MRPLLLGLFLVLTGTLALFWWVKLDHGAPTVALEPEANVVGRNASWEVVARASGKPGLRRVEVWLSGEGKTVELLGEDFPAVSWIGSRVAERRLRIDADLGARGVSEGNWRMEVFADTHAWHVIPQRRQPLVQRNLQVDLTAPLVELLTTQHNLRLGGASLALFRVGEDTASAGVVVADYFFPAVRGYFGDPNVALCIFAVPENLSTGAAPSVRVTDAVGNTRSAALPCNIRGRSFRERTLEIDDAFLERKIPELYASLRLPEPADLVQGYLHVNRDIRRDSEKRLKEITAKSEAVPLWDGAFRRQSNAAPMSNFADRRKYVYKGEPIDHQTHLGFDLASLQRAPVEAAQNGVVVFADMLGIYGNTVVIDHGLGIFSLYGHLSTFAMPAGQRVQAGQSVGQTGETGLAGGDHLHFSIMIHGTHVDPVEWWDPHWLKDHVSDPLAMFPVKARETEEVRKEIVEQGPTNG